MGPKLLENNTYNVQAKNSHVMVLPEFIVNYIVKISFGYHEPKYSSKHD